VIPPIRFGSETPPPLDDVCHDCGTPIGGRHHYGCDVEECPHHRQAITCDLCPVLLNDPYEGPRRQLMAPYAPMPACLEPRCPNRAVPGGRGRCQAHKRTEAERGDGTAHRRERRAALPGARCSVCGSTEKLQRDHRIPHSLGGSDSDTSNKRWLCRMHHDAIGLKSNSRARER
jgi:5-methylcytosine-specific restriction endonuclease McrA